MDKLFDTVSGNLLITQAEQDANNNGDDEEKDKIENDEELNVLI